MTTLDKELSARITRLAEEGDREGEKENWDGQIEKYLQAWELVPEPKYEWDGGTWITSGIAEGFFQKKNYQGAKPYFHEGLKCYRGEQHSFILLRLGEIYYDEGDLDQARQYLCRAWDISEGREFVDEPKKYRDFILKQK